MRSLSSNFARFAGLMLAAAIVAGPAVAAERPAGPVLQFKLPGKLIQKTQVHISQDPVNRAGYISVALQSPGEKLGEKDLDLLTEMLAKQLHGDVRTRGDLSKILDGGALADKTPTPARRFVGYPTGMRQPVLTGLAYVAEGRLYVLMSVASPFDLKEEGALNIFRGIINEEGLAFDLPPLAERRCPTGWLLAGPHPRLPGNPVAEVSLQVNLDFVKDVPLYYAAFDIHGAPKSTLPFLMGTDEVQALDSVTEVLAQVVRGKVTEHDLKVDGHPVREFRGVAPIDLHLLTEHTASSDEGKPMTGKMPLVGRAYLSKDGLTVLMVYGDDETVVSRNAKVFFDGVHIKAESK